MTSLTPEDLRALEERELETAIQRIHDGKPITRAQRELINRAAERGRPVPPSGENDLGKRDFLESGAASLHDTEAGEWGRPQIAELYAVAGEPLSLRTIDRCNAIGRLPDVGAPPPWEDPRRMAEWYRFHYRSDVSRPAKPGGKRTLPQWIMAAMDRAAARPPAAAAVPAVPTGAAAVSVLPMGDGLATARAIVERVYSRWVAVQNDPGAAPGAERAYMDAFEKLQMAEERARKAGDTEGALRAIVEEKVDRILNRLPSHLAAELAALRPEVLRSAADPASWPAWCAEFFAAVGERLARTKFTPALAA